MTNLAILKGDENQPALVTGATSPQQPPIIIEPRKILLQSIGELLEKHKNLPEQKFIWRGIKEQSFGFIFGAPKSGKSSLCECLAIHIAAGKKSFLGTQLSVSGPVTYISLEEDERSRMSRNKLQIQSLSVSELALLKSNFKISNDEFPLTLVTDLHWELLKENIVYSNAKVVIIDSFTHLCPERVEDSSEAQKIIIKLKTLVKELGITIICIHHTPKNNDRPLNIDSLAGSRVLGQGADFMIGVKSINNQRYIKDVAYRHTTCEEQVLCFEITQSREIQITGNANEFDLLPEPGRPTNAKPLQQSNKIILLNYLRNYGKMPGARLVNEFTIQGIMSKATVYNCLKRLLNAKQVQKDPEGNFFISADSLSLHAPEPYDPLDS